MYFDEERGERSPEELLREEVRSRERERDAKRAFKKSINKISRSIFLYNIMALIFAFFSFFLLIFLWNIDWEADITRLQDPLQRALLGDGFITMMGIFLSFVLLLLLLRKERLRIFLSEKKMSAYAFFSFLLLHFAIQGIFTYLNGILEFLFNLFGLTLEEAFIAATDPGEDAAALFYTAIFAPLAEEIIYRGLLLRYLEKYGRVFAILMSAMFFAVMHGNPTQGIFAFLVGILYGYIALEYSVFWTIFLHMFNNLGLGILYGMVSDRLPSLVERGSEILFILAGALLFFWNRKEIGSYLLRHKTPKGLYAQSFSSLWMIVFLLFHILFMISMIKPL